MPKIKTQQQIDMEAAGAVWEDFIDLDNWERTEKGNLRRSWGDLTLTVFRYRNYNTPTLRPAQSPISQAPKRPVARARQSVYETDALRHVSPRKRGAIRDAGEIATPRTGVYKPENPTL